MIDTHCHIGYEGMDSEAAVANARKAGLKAIIACGYPRDMESTLRVEERHKGFVFLAAGLHPIDIKDLSEKEVEDYLGFIRKNAGRIVAIGEIGLDYHWYPQSDSEEGRRFISVFKRCLALAKELGKPAVLHTRKAEQECFDILMESGVKDAVFHCYSGSLMLAKRIIDEGFFISLATNLMRSKNTKKIARSFPLERLLIETDSPFLSPVPGKNNEPANVRLAAEEVAKLRSLSFNEVWRQFGLNAVKFFSLPEALVK